MFVLFVFISVLTTLNEPQLLIVSKMCVLNHYRLLEIMSRSVGSFRGLIFRVSILDGIYCGFAVFCAVFLFLIGPFALLVKRRHFWPSYKTTGSPSSIYEQLFICWPLHCYVTRAICIFIRICIGKITIVSVIYEKSSYLTLAECFSLLCSLWADLLPFCWFLLVFFLLSLYILWWWRWW